MKVRRFSNLLKLVYTGETTAATIEGENPLVNAQIVEEGSSAILNFDCTRVWVWVDEDGAVTRVPRNRIGFEAGIVIKTTVVVIISILQDNKTGVHLLLFYRIDCWRVNLLDNLHCESVGLHKTTLCCPAMNTFTWNNPFTERHLMLIDELGITLVPPMSKRLACSDYGNGAMAEPSLILSTVRPFLESRSQLGIDNMQQ
ncbi:hypothetical protein Vadar_017767 [Vaccinium darrowii]|uniref:Uncharacterized protein n=1 Tax=Vaccinium darrowii TaxID=229202 RepID=A0ACB7YXC5_9ERIC|nr:hypothetical protein Vadar_017767 [Vaccinium darrowii]